MKNILHFVVGLVVVMTAPIWLWGAILYTFGKEITGLGRDLVGPKS